MSPFTRNWSASSTDRGARIDHIYYCPHHPTEGKPPYNVVCSCRKPGIGMLQQAAEDFGLDLRRSFVVGDRIVDIQAGRAAGATTILVHDRLRAACPARSAANKEIVPDFIAVDIAEAATIIMQKTNGETAEE